MASLLPRKPSVSCGSDIPKLFDTSSTFLPVSPTLVLTSACAADDRTLASTTPFDSRNAADKLDTFCSCALVASATRCSSLDNSFSRPVNAKPPTIIGPIPLDSRLPNPDLTLPIKPSPSLRDVLKLSHDLPT